MNPKSTANMRTTSAFLGAAIVLAASTSLHAQSLSNGGFESGLSGWTVSNQVGSDGTFFSQTGTTTPINAFDVPAPPEGLRAAMTDSSAGGGHALWQNFTVPALVSPTSLRFSIYLNNGAGTYSTPNTLDWAATNQNGTLNLNQQARVDIMTSTGDIFSVANADVLLNLFATTSATPAVAGYLNFDIDVTTLLQAHAGETLRLRFAETDNVNFFNFGVDNVAFAAIPAPTTGVLAAMTVAGMARRRWRFVVV